MLKTGNHVSGLRIAYIGGGSRNWAWNLLGDLALEPALSGEVLLYDIDFEAARANEIIGNSIAENRGKWTYRAVRLLPEALEGADFVIISILPGTLDEMAVDVHLPERYGIYQSVGDTVGPGGILRAMRTLPMFHVIAEAVKAYCPQAWVINYTNPMSVCVGTLHSVWPRIKAFGCCHELFSLQQEFANLVNKTYHPDTPATYQDIAVNPLGINHFTFVDKAAYQGQDVLPLFDRVAREHADDGDALAPEEGAHIWDKHFHCVNKVKFDLYLRYGLVPAGGDRHVAEFCPPWYLKNPQNVARWGFMLTPVAHRKQMEAEKRAASRAMVAGEKAFEVRPSGEDEVAQMKALLGLEPLVTNVNLPNRGQIENLPLGAVVETNVIFQQDAIVPMLAGSIPGALHPLIHRHAAGQSALVEATRAHDLESAFTVFLGDPLVDLTRDDARALFDAMVQGTRPYLDWWM